MAKSKDKVVTGEVVTGIVETKNEIVLEHNGFKRVVGRPPKFEPEYCQMLIKHMSQGYSFEGFAGVILVQGSTLHNWKEVFPEFMEAYKLGCALRRLNDDINLEKIVKGEIKGHAGAILFKMRAVHRVNDDLLGFKKFKLQLISQQIDKMTIEDVKQHVKEIMSKEREFKKSEKENDQLYNTWIASKKEREGHPDPFETDKQIGGSSEDSSKTENT